MWSGGNSQVESQLCQWVSVSLSKHHKSLSISKTRMAVALCPKRIKYFCQKALKMSLLLVAVSLERKKTPKPWTPFFWYKSGWQWCWFKIAENLSFSIWVPESHASTSQGLLGEPALPNSWKTHVAHHWLTYDIKDCKTRRGICRFFVGKRRKQYQYKQHWYPYTLWAGSYQHGDISAWGQQAGWCLPRKETQTCEQLELTPAL